MRRLLTLLLLVALCGPAHARELVDAFGRTSLIPDKVERVICSGPGCLRLLTYLQAQEMVVGVDEIERRRGTADARPYALANPRFKTLPLIGAHIGRDNPELIMALEPAPQVILKAYVSGLGMSPDELHEKTRLPVVAFDYGDLGERRAVFYRALRLMAAVVGREQRAEEVVRYFEAAIADIEQRSRRSASPAPSVYVGGVSFRGTLGFQSTEPSYTPLGFLGIRNIAHTSRSASSGHVVVAKEMILEWDPELVLLDLGTIAAGSNVGGLHELRTDPAYGTLRAFRDDNIWGVLPYNLYTNNYDSILANAYFIGTLTRKSGFADIDPVVKANEIYTFLVGKPVFQRMDELLGGLAFRKVSLK